MLINTKCPLNTKCLLTEVTSDVYKAREFRHVLTQMSDINIYITLSGRTAICITVLQSDTWLVYEILCHMLFLKLGTI